MKPYGTLRVPTASSIPIALESLAAMVPPDAERLDLEYNLDTDTLVISGTTPAHLFERRVQRHLQDSIVMPPTENGWAERDALFIEAIGWPEAQPLPFSPSIRRADRERAERQWDDAMRRLWGEHLERESAAAHPPATAAPAPQRREVLSPQHTAIPPTLARRMLAWFGFPM